MAGDIRSYDEAVFHEQWPSQYLGFTGAGGDIKHGITIGNVRRPNRAYKASWTTVRCRTHRSLRPRAFDLMYEGRGPR